MALEKTINLPSGVSGNYHRMVAFTWERGTRQASAHFALYKDAATAIAGEPLRPIVAKLRLSGEKFDEYLSAAALAAADGDVVAQLYLAARAVSAAYAAEPATEMAAHMVSDFGRDVYADAEDV
jgi:hypothetical protein